jgi:hypothetical protein
VDAGTNIVTLTADVWRYWFDQRLSAGGQRVAVNPAEIWTPDVDLVEKVNNFQESCSTTRALLLSDEYVERLPRNMTRYNVFWTQTCVLPVKCHIVMEEFPFDTHTCNLTFTPWTDPSYVLLPANMSAADLITQEFEIKLDTHKETIITKLPLPGGQEDVDATGIRFFASISRYSRYYMLNLVYPTIMMVVLSWFVFFTPITKSDRLAYSVTLLLAAMAVQFITADRRPAEASDGWIDKLMTGSYILIIIPILETSILFRIESWIEHRVDHEVDCEDTSRSAKERLHVMALGHDSIRMFDRIARVMYPMLVALFMLFLFGPGSPALQKRHDNEAPLSVSMVSLAVFTIPVLCVIFWFSLMSWIRLGPHTRRQLTDPLHEALMDPHRPDLHHELVDIEEASKDSDEESASQASLAKNSRGHGCTAHSGERGNHANGIPNGFHPRADEQGRWNVFFCSCVFVGSCAHRSVATAGS